MCMAKLHARPSNEYRYEHYDPLGVSADEADATVDPHS